MNLDCSMMAGRVDFKAMPKIEVNDYLVLHSTSRSAFRGQNHLSVVEY